MAHKSQVGHLPCAYIWPLRLCHESMFVALCTVTAVGFRPSDIELQIIGFDLEGRFVFCSSWRLDLLVIRKFQLPHIICSS